MQTGNQKLSGFIRTLGLSIVLVLTSCAKELAEKKPDNFDRDHISIGAFNEKHQIVTTGGNIQQLAIKSNVASGIFALNEKSTYPVKMTAGHPALRKLFENFTIEASRPGEVFNIKFKLLDDQIIAYMETEGHEISLANRAIEHQYKGTNVVPLFSFPVSSYGIVRRDENDFGEKTHRIEYVNTVRTEATHLKLTATAENRKLSGLRGYDRNNPVFLKQKIEGRKWSLAEVSSLYNISNAGNLPSAMANDKNISMIIKDNTAFIMAEFPLSELNAIERAALDNKDPRIVKCAGKADCALKPIFTAAVSKKILELSRDEKTNETLGKVLLKDAVGDQVADFIVIGTNTEFIPFEYNETITGILPKYIYSYDQVQNVTKTAKEAQAFIPTDDEINSNVVNYLVADKKTWIRIPVSKSELTDIELAAVGNDPRFEVCGNKVLTMSGLKASDCILKPVQYVVSTPKKVDLVKVPGKELPTFKAVPTTLDEEGSFLEIINNVAPKEFNYNRFLADKLHDKKRFVNKFWKGSELRAIFKNTKKFEEDATYTSAALNNYIYFLKVGKRSHLSAIETAYLDGGDPRFQNCSKELAQLSNVREDSCVAVASEYVNVTNAILEFQKEDNLKIPALQIRTGVDRKLATHVYFEDTSEVKKLHSFDAQFSKEGDWRTKDKYIKGQILSGKDAFESLGIPEIKNLQDVKIKLVGERLWVLAPINKNDLHIIEREALENDPRFESCSESMAKTIKIAQADCVMRPLYSRYASFSQFVFYKQNNSDIPRLTIEDRTPELGNLFYVNTKSNATKFDYMKRLHTADKIYTHVVKSFNTEDEYVYVPMTHGTPREVIAADPFYQGNEKLVKIKFTKTGLQVYELDKDDRFQDNPHNAKPVLEIPGTYEDYRCTKDNDGRCTSTVEYDKDKEWHEKRFFVPTLENIKLQEKNTLDLFTVEGSGCVYLAGVRLVDHEISPSAINIELEKTYKTRDSWSCIRNLYFADTTSFSGFSNAGFTVNFNYSIVRLKDLASPDYEKVEYPVYDHRRFGFFKDYRADLPDTFDPNRKDRLYLMNRWNPKRGEIVYHLSDTFNEPGQELIKKATYDSVKTINESLKKAKAGISIKLEEPSGKKAGDLRNNMIVLITDPLSNGLLGYGPTVTNPKTGEIIQGHINMYSGVIRSMSRRIWESMVDLTETEKQNKIDQNRPADLDLRDKTGAANIPLSKSFNPDLLASVRAPEAASAAVNAGQSAQAQKFANIVKDLNAKALNEAKIENFNKMLSKVSLSDLQKREFARLHRKVKDTDTSKMNELEKRLEFIKNKEKRWSENNAYSVEAFQIAHTSKTLLPGIKDIAGVMTEDGKTLKRWNKLTKKQQKQALDIIIPFAYTSTFVHEFGHNLGLRHNFQGSFDADNFYTDEEAKKLGMRGAPAYSSIMDYGVSELNELSVFGKYDIAALRFGYAREVEKDDGTFVKVPTTLRQMNKDQPDLALKSYDFCTDGNASLSSTCNRFDEGSTLVEIAKSMIQRYEDYYKYRNFRDDRNEFSSYDIWGYLVARYREFNRIRGIFEDWEFFTTFFGMEIMQVGCSPEQTAQFPVCEMINDRVEAVKIIGDFFVNVLKTPDRMCAVAAQANPQQLTEIKPLLEIYEDIKYDIDYTPTTCFDPAIKEQLLKNTDQNQQAQPLVPVAMAGKFLNGTMANTNSEYFEYSNDRDIRGIWIDKVLAMKALFQRDSGRPVTEDDHMSLMYHDETAQKASSFLQHITLGRPLDTVQPFVTEAGQKIMLDYNLGSDQIIEGPEDGLWWMKLFLDLPLTGDASLNKTLLSQASRNGLVRDHATKDESRAIVNFFSIRRADVELGMEGSGIMKLETADYIYGAGEVNSLAGAMMDTISTSMFLEQVPQDRFLAILQYRLNPPKPELGEVETIAINLPDGLLEQMIPLAQQGFDLASIKPRLIELFGETVANQMLTVYTLGADGMQKVLEVKQSIGQRPEGGLTDLPAEVEIRLFDVPVDYLVAHQRGVLRSISQGYINDIFPIMPKHIKALNW